MNVRLFRVEGSASDVVMDTLGLQVFGLPDLQCHCHGIELPRLATYLRNAANYVFERGDVIRDGDTIEGHRAGGEVAVPAGGGADPARPARDRPRPRR